MVDYNKQVSKKYLEKVIDLNLTGTIYRIGAATFTADTGSHIDLTDTAGNVEFDLADAALEFAGSSIERNTGTNLVADT